MQTKCDQILRLVTFFYSPGRPPSMGFVGTHVRIDKSVSNETDGRSPVSLLDRGSGTEFLPRPSGDHHYFCSHDSSVAARANWTRPGVCIHAFLWRCRNHSTEDPHVPGRWVDCA